MQPSDACVSLVTCCEGVELEAYPDPGTGAEPWTIGFGHTGPDVGPDTKWTHAQAEAALKRDLEQTAAGVDRLLGDVQVPQHQFDALTSFAYNTGLHNLQASTLLRLVLEGKPTQAAAEFPKWIHAGGHVLPGLVKRRELERKLFLYGPAH